MGKGFTPLEIANSHGHNNMHGKSPEQRKSLTGFTVIELVAYVAVLAMLLSAVLAFLLWAVKSQAKSIAMAEVLAAGQRAFEVLGREIAGAKSVYTPTSVFAVSPGQLSLETVSYVPQGETSSTIDFYLCEEKLCIKRESQEPLALTPDTVSLTSLQFLQALTGNNLSSVQVAMTFAAKTASAQSEYQASLTLTNTFSLRSYGP